MGIMNKPMVEYEDGFCLENLDLPARPLGRIYVFGLIALLVIATCIYPANNSSVTPRSFLPDSIIVILTIAFIFTHKQMQEKPVNWLTPDVLFMSIFVVFHFGYIFLYAFGAVPYDEEVFWAPAKVHKAVLFSFYCLVLFLLGYEFAVSRRKEFNRGFLSSIPKVPFAISVILIVGAFLMFWIPILRAGLGTLMTQYSSLIRLGSRFSAVSLNIAAVGIALYCASSILLYHKALYGITKYIVIIFITGILLMGDRGGFVYLASIPFVAFSYFQRKIKMISAVGIVLLLFFVMAVIGIARNLIVLNVAEMYKTYQKSEAGTKTNAVVQSLVEFGVSIKTVVIAMDLVPNHGDYWMGRSYFYSIQYVMPNVIPGATRVAGASTGPGTWLTETAFGPLSETWGRGGSIAMEAYINFGLILGAMSFFALGWMYRILYERVLTQLNLFNIMLLLGAISALVYWIRNTSVLFTRTFIWTLIVAYFINRLFCNQNPSGADYETS